MGFPLPPELIQIVLEFIIADENANVPPYVTQSTNLAPYATVNRDWQAIIESQTFSSIKIDTNKRLAEFKQLPWDQLSWSQRRSHIRKIHFIVELESYDGEARTRYENEEEIQRNSKVLLLQFSHYSMLYPNGRTTKRASVFRLWRSPPAILAPKVPRQ